MLFLVREIVSYGIHLVNPAFPGTTTMVVCLYLSVNTLDEIELKACRRTGFHSHPTHTPSLNTSVTTVMSEVALIYANTTTANALVWSPIGGIPFVGLTQAVGASLFLVGTTTIPGIPAAIAMGAVFVKCVGGIQTAFSIAGELINPPVPPLRIGTGRPAKVWRNHSYPTKVRNRTLSKNVLRVAPVIDMNWYDEIFANPPWYVYTIQTRIIPNLRKVLMSIFTSIGGKIPVFARAQLHMWVSYGREWVKPYFELENAPAYYIFFQFVYTILHMLLCIATALFAVLYKIVCFPYLFVAHKLRTVDA